MTAKRPATQRKPAGILLRYRHQDTAYGVTRKTTARIARTLGLSETQVVHVALANLARQTLPRYEPDDGPLTPEAPRNACSNGGAGLPGTAGGRHRLVPLSAPGNLSTGTETAPRPRHRHRPPG